MGPLGSTLACAFFLFLLVSGPCTRRPQTLPEEEELRRRRADMVEFQLRGREIHNERVLKAMGKVPRHEFVLPEFRRQAYFDSPLPIGESQTISQPYIVAFMTQAVDPKSHHRVLEIGTGSGYQAAILAELAGEVFSIEILPTLADQARDVLQRLNYQNVHVAAGDGYQGWPDRAPFDSILVTAAAPQIPAPLLEQLKVGGVLVIPVGEPGSIQYLTVVRREKDGYRQSRVMPVRFVPMTGEAQEKEPRF
jgi:protein-L-isoaspartate(D-aspartate) O-methyltransferase